LKKEIDNLKAQVADMTAKGQTSDAELKTANDKIQELVKESKKRLFVYSFNLIDIKTRMYLCYGMSFKSEKQAFISAVEMLKELDIKINSLRLDRYYQQYYVELLEKELGDVKFYIIPKKNATIKGTYKWKRMLHDFVNNTTEYLEEYYLKF